MYRIDAAPITPTPQVPSTVPDCSSGTHYSCSHRSCSYRWYGLSRRWSSGSTAAWRRVRAEVLARDSYRCRRPLTGCTHTATQVHHTQARELVGDDPRYLLATCQPCNNKVGDPSTGNPDPVIRMWW